MKLLCPPPQPPLCTRNTHTSAPTSCTSHELQGPSFHPFLPWSIQGPSPWQGSVSLKVKHIYYVTSTVRYQYAQPRVCSFLVYVTLCTDAALCKVRCMRTSARPQQHPAHHVYASQGWTVAATAVGRATRSETRSPKEGNTNTHEGEEEDRS